MTYHIPTDDEILGAVRKILLKYHTVISQHRLKTLVEKELRTKKKHFSVSGARLRRLIINSGLVQVETYTREGDPNKILHKCPVCDGSLQRVKNQTIYGGEVTLELCCRVCGYWTGKKKKIPTLYVFHMK